MDQGGSVGSTLEEGTHHSGGRETVARHVPLLVFRARYQKNTYSFVLLCNGKLHGPWPLGILYRCKDYVQLLYLSAGIACPHLCFMSIEDPLTNRVTKGSYQI